MKELAELLTWPLAAVAIAFIWSAMGLDINININKSIETKERK